jgi:uncharacterized protein (DUF2147 family)
MMVLLPVLLSSVVIDEQKVDDKDLILGNWKPSNGRSVVQMYKGNPNSGEDPNKYYGKIVWLLEPNDENGNPRTDTNNDDKEMKKQPVKGLVIVKDMEFEEVDGKIVSWEGGTIYDPNNGSTYDFQAEIDKKNENIMEGRGYIGVSLFGRTDTWTRLVKK